MKEAIVTDVSDEIEEVVEEVISPRDQAMADIVKNTIEDRNLEIGVVEPEVEPEKEPEEDPPEVDPPEEETVTLQVNGEEVVVPRSQVEEAGVRTLQKETSADARLEKAASVEAELARREKELEAMEADLLTRDQPEIEPNDIGKEFADALYEDEGKVAGVITQITQSIAELKAANVSAAKKVEDDKATENARLVKHYHDSYEDIANDADMHSALNRRLSGIAEKDPSLTPSQVVDSAAKEVYEKFGITKVVEKKKTPSDIKQDMPKQPKKASGRKVPIPEKKPKTRSDILKQMQSGRGVVA
jgi:hypothetical protein